ncbi:MAG TPA: sugar ABC transporter substrate-binding protein [Coleofasciculaceae cyanobacterium]
MRQTLQKFKSFGYDRLRSLLACWLLVLLALSSGCAARQDDHGVILQLSTWGSAQEITVLKSLLQEFEQTHPNVRVNLLHIPENYYQKLHILVAGDLTPDVIFTNSLSFPIYAAHGVFMDLTPLLAQSTDLSPKDFYPASLQAFTWQAAPNQPILGALPRDISNLVIFYNKDVFKAAGVPEPKAGWTWEQFRETARQVTLDRNNDGDPEVFGFSFYATPPLFWLPFVWSAGGDLFSPDLRHVVLDRPAATQGLQFYADLRNKWHVAPKKVESGGATMSQLFMQQKLAMMVNGRWSVPVLREQARFNWDVVPMPVGPSGRSRVGIDASGYAISAKTPHPRESFELIRFLLSKPAIEKVAESGLIVPARPDVAESELFLAPRQDPAHGKAFLNVITDGVPTHTPPRWNELSEELGLALESVWDGKQDADSAVRAANPKLERMLEVGL